VSESLRDLFGTTEAPKPLAATPIEAPPSPEPATKMGRIEKFLARQAIYRNKELSTREKIAAVRALSRK
jgi:hypothetical protein